MITEYLPRLAERRLEALGLSAAAFLLAGSTLINPSSAAAAEDDAQDAAISAVPYAVTTYNILGSNHVETGREVGGSVKARAERAVQYIIGKAGAPAPSDIVGVQELQSDQWRMFNAMLPDRYDPIPKGHATENSIYYNKDRFKLIKDGVVSYPYYSDVDMNGGRGKAIWARFEDKQTGQTVSVFNTHPVAWNKTRGSDSGGAKKRLAASKDAIEWSNKTQRTHPEDAVYIIGDMNSENVLVNHYDPFYDVQFKDRALRGDRNKLMYCLATEPQTGLQDSHDMSRGVSGHCPTKQRGPDYKNVIDWVYTTPENTRVLVWDHVKSGATRHASDHYPVTTVNQATSSALKALQD